MNGISGKMYKIGKAVNVVLIAAAAILVLLGVSFSTNYSAFKNLKVADARALGSAFLIAGIIYLAISIAALIVARHLERKTSEFTENYGVHIGMIATGIISVNLFYLFGGIFGWAFEKNGRKKLAEEEENKGDIA